MPMNKEEKAEYLAMIEFKMKIIASMENRTVTFAGLINEIAMDDEESIV